MAPQMHRAHLGSFYATEGTLGLQKKMHFCLVHEAKFHRGYSCIAKEAHVGFFYKTKSQAKSQRGYVFITKGGPLGLI
jgi:hypothetical protein